MITKLKRRSLDRIHIVERYLQVYYAYRGSMSRNLYAPSTLRAFLKKVIKKGRTSNLLDKYDLIKGDN